MGDYMNDALGKEMDWDSKIENDGNDFEPLPAGVYEFTVHTVERARYPGSEKMCACNMANLDLVVKDSEGKERHVFDSLYLNSKVEWRLSQFFISIGQKKKGEPLVPNWTTVPCSTGKMEVTVNQYTNKNGEQRKNNKVSSYLPKEEKAFEPGRF